MVVARRKRKGGGRRAEKEGEEKKAMVVGLMENSDGGMAGREVDKVGSITAIV